MQDIFSSQTNYVINDKNKSDGMELMKSLKDETISNNSKDNNLDNIIILKNDSGES